jgi:hypothetical protein
MLSGGVTHVNVRSQNFHSGPTRPPRNDKLKSRCGECDFQGSSSRSDSKTCPIGAAPPLVVPASRGFLRERIRLFPHSQVG